MKTTCTYLDDSNVVMTVSTGRLTIEEISIADKEAKACAEKHGSSKYLFDDTHAEMLFKFTDYYTLFGSWKDIGISLLDCVAVVVPENNKQAEDFKFFETLCLNRGLRVRLFDTVDEGLVWLKTQ